MYWLLVIKHFSPADIDECTEEIDRCEQDCMNTIGSYNCSCGSGFIIDVDGYSCDGKKIVYQLAMFT